MNMRLFGVAIFILSFGIANGQSSYVPMGNRAYQIYDRLEIKSGINSPIHSSLKYYSRKDLVEFVKLIEDSGVELSDKDYADMQYLLDDSNEFIDEFFVEVSNSSGEYEKKYIDSIFYTVKEKEIQKNPNSRLSKSTRDPVLRYFFNTPGNFYEIETENFQLKLNPVVNVKFGKDLEGNEDLIFQNTRGIELRGLIDHKIYFYTNLYETQGRFNDFIMRRIDKYKAIPGFGSYKDHKSSVSNSFSGYDFPNSQAYLGLNVTKHVAVELGHNRHFLGNGYHSLLLNDYANNYFYLKFSTKIWKFHYQNLFAELAPISDRQNPLNVLLPKKYMANHYLSFKPRKNIEIGLFETVIFSRQDHFEFQYLNPIILYRTVEFFLDSPDNVLIGLNGKWNLFNRFSIYGQVIVDEFNLSNLRQRNGWWANKIGTQIGMKYIDAFGIDHLDLQFEYNSVRPYTYAQNRLLEGFDEQTVSNYSHFNQPLAHPLGANFNETVFLLNFQPINNLQIRGKFLYALYGDSQSGSNWGNEILYTTDLKESEFGNFIGQGVETKVSQLACDISYEFFHNYFLEIHGLIRNQNSALDQLDIKTSYFGAGIRANISNYRIDY